MKKKTFSPQNKFGQEKWIFFLILHWTDISKLDLTISLKWVEEQFKPYYWILHSFFVVTFPSNLTYITSFNTQKYTSITTLLCIATTKQCNIGANAAGQGFISQLHDPCMVKSLFWERENKTPVVIWECSSLLYLCISICVRAQALQ